MAPALSLLSVMLNYLNFLGFEFEYTYVVSPNYPFAW